MRASCSKLPRESLRGTTVEVPAEMHIFQSGGHGYGIRKHGTAVDGWENLAAVWLKANWLK